MFGLGILGIWLFIGATWAGFVVWLVLRARMREKPLSRTNTLIVLVLAAASMFAAVGTLMGFLKAFEVIGGESVDPSQKARLLAEGISEAMNCTALGLVLWLPTAIALIVMTIKRKDSKE